MATRFTYTTVTSVHIVSHVEIKMDGNQKRARIISHDDEEDVAELRRRMMGYQAQQVRARESMDRGLHQHVLHVVESLRNSLSFPLPHPPNIIFEHLERPDALRGHGHLEVEGGHRDDREYQEEDEGDNLTQDVGWGRRAGGEQHGGGLGEDRANAADNRRWIRQARCRRDDEEDRAHLRRLTERGAQEDGDGT